MQDSWGGHTMVAFGGVYRVENAKFYMMGQTGELSRYPLHFHVAQMWGRRCYAKHNSIHKGCSRPDQRRRGGPPGASPSHQASTNQAWTRFTPGHCGCEGDALRHRSRLHDHQGSHGRLWH